MSEATPVPENMDEHVDSTVSQKTGMKSSYNGESISVEVAKRKALDGSIDEPKEKMRRTDSAISVTTSKAGNTDGKQVGGSTSTKVEPSAELQSRPDAAKSETHDTAENMAIDEQPVRSSSNSTKDKKQVTTTVSDEPSLDLPSNALGDNEYKPASEEESSGAYSSDFGEEIVSKYVKLDPLPDNVAPLNALTKAETRELENSLQIRKGGWRDDWIGNLAFADEDIPNPDGKSRDRGKKSLFRWAERNKQSKRLLNNLLRVVYNLDETPEHARKVLAAAEADSVESIQNAVRRVSYDPEVLRQDGWTTAKSLEPIGASGGPHRIGEMVSWQGYTGVVIAYDHDDHLGDLWKAMWIEEFDTFDLEAEELADAKKRFEKRIKQREQKEKPQAQAANLSGSRRSGRTTSPDFTVNGIEHGIVLAVSYSRGSRPGVFWPARVMHFSEMKSQSKRGSQKQKVDVVFLAPYWNATSTLPSKESYSESLSRHGDTIFNSGALFELETIDASPDCIQEYPYTGSSGLDIDQLRSSFKFIGLPKAAFPRFVDAHRLALGLKEYSKTVMKSTINSDDLHLTTAGLFEAHPIAAQAAQYPDAVLHLPFGHILSQLPHPDEEEKKHGLDDLESGEEPVLQLGSMLELMKPPKCWGYTNGKASQGMETPDRKPIQKVFKTPPLLLNFDSNDGSITLERFTLGLPFLVSLLAGADSDSSRSFLLKKSLDQLLVKLPKDSDDFKALSADTKEVQRKALVKLWVVVKTHGEDVIGSLEQEQQYLMEWRKLCERIYKYITVVFSTMGVGNKVSYVMTDSLCNQHLTSNGCFERAVRLPAALKAAKEVGAGKNESLQLMTSVKPSYMEMAENKVIRRAHTKTYLQRIKKRCMAIADDTTIASLTEDSEGNGGADTKGSRGSWKAAIAGVGSALQALDMILHGECVNVFSITRPPGHHAGKELHAMKAVSNGFCVLNPVACAAIHAATPVSEGGHGLRRICVIDVDVHHGNGTQDILGSTYDPRFLYVSLHAGGPHLNGVDPSDDDPLPNHHLGRSALKGIFPGRCGDSSPHPGVLNIPLGPRVTSHAIGTALVTKVTPAVERFSPDLIIMSTGFDAHKNDPLGLGGLSAEDFGTLTEVICKLAHKTCSGRILSVLEGGYGVPCCQPPVNLFDPEEALKQVALQDQQKQETREIPTNGSTTAPSTLPAEVEQPPKPSIDTQTAERSVYTASKSDSAAKPLDLLELGDDLPETMKDDVDIGLARRLDRCHKEGFMHCVREHVKALEKSNARS
ncbi:unnamed protein product [Cylindrotheca closterium]|uniref:histone deacetylase n=1 Tax=Cylindrotheca closterium TaxID=2856 RepID=A0AAD2CQU7_9STRA|nr:unnamed protein product [Cylindrotheca closterium]